MRIAAVVLVLLCQQDPLKEKLPRLKPTEPKDAVKTFVLKPGYSIELVAAEPIVESPVDMAFDEVGRLWVVEMVDYPFDEKEGSPPQGRLVLLEDSKGEGRYDTRRVIAEKLHWPTGLALWDGGAFVFVAPDLLYFKDGKRNVFLTGFGGQNVQGLANNPKWGLDNWFHATSGSNGGKIRLKSGEEVVINGRDFRFRPTGEFETCSGGGQFGQSMDEYGRRFVCSNSNQARHIVLEDRYLARNPYYAVPQVTASIGAEGDAGPVYRSSPDEPWRIVRTQMRVAGEVKGPIEGGGKPSGYVTSATGIFWHDGHLYVGEVGGNLVQRKRLTPNGCTFRAERIDEKSEFLASTDIWFRPCNFATGPDGALYICDIYRECIEHPSSIPDSIKKYLDMTSGKDRGRLWRVKKDGSPAWKKPALKTTEDFVAALARPEAWWRQAGSRLLYQKQDKSAIPMIEKLLSHERPETRAAALWALEGLGVRRGDVLLKDPVTGVREQAVQLASLEALYDVDEADPRVRLEIAWRMSETKDPRAGKALDRIRPGADKWLSWAIGVAAGEMSATKAIKPSQPIVREPAPDRKKAVETYQEALKKPADAKRGKEIFVKTCAGCHKAKGEGQDVGPDLATVRDKSPDDLLIAILDPNREVNPQYVSTRILTKDGLVLDGIVATETATSVTLKREKGETDTILKVKIEKMVRSTLSLMPEGLEKNIDFQQMADLIKFIKE
jgi:putative membrane-bound dehydrogenase-like protein